MLQIKSFKIDDSEGMSKFLKEYVLHGKSNILSSEGVLAIPYEDGLPPTNGQIITTIMEEKNTMMEALRPIVHSQRVMEVELVGIDKQIEEQKTLFKDIIPAVGKKETAEEKEVNSAIRKTNEKADKEIKRLENVKAQKENQLLMNQAEITRIHTNLAVYNEQIHNLENPTEESK